MHLNIVYSFHQFASEQRLVISYLESHQGQVTDGYLHDPSERGDTNPPRMSSLHPDVTSERWKTLGTQVVKRISTHA